MAAYYQLYAKASYKDAGVSLHTDKPYIVLASHKCINNKQQMRISVGDIWWTCIVGKDVDKFLGTKYPSLGLGKEQKLSSQLSDQPAAQETEH